MAKKQVNNKINKPLSNQILVRILTVVIAVFIWVIIVFTQNPEISVSVKNIPVTFTNELILNEKGLCILHSDKKLTTTAKLKGKRTDLFKILNNVYATVNLGGIETVGLVRATAEISIPNSGVSLNKNGAAPVNVIVEKLKEKDIPIVVEQIGTNKNFLVKSDTEKEYLHIKGPETEIDKIEEAVIHIDISNIEEDRTDNKEYIYIDKNESDVKHFGNVVSDSETINVINTVYRKKVVNIDAEYTPENAQRFDISVVSTEPSEAVVGIIDEEYGLIKSVYATLPENLHAGNNQTFTAPVFERDGIYLGELSSAEIEVNIKEKHPVHISVPVEYQNISKDKLKDYTRSIAISVLATDERLANAKIVAVADLSGYTKGEYTVPVTINAPKEITVGTNYKVEVTIE